MVILMLPALRAQSGEDETLSVFSGL